MIYAIDLEGVLAPEIWPTLGTAFSVPDLHLTTRDLGDFDDLMRRRVSATRQAGLSLKQLQGIAHAMEPFLGARDFLARLRLLGQVVVISDTFHELAEPLAQKLGGHSLFANHFELDGDGSIRGFRLRIRGQKERIVSGFRSAGFEVAAMGDSLNDLSLLRACDYPVLYRPVTALLEAFPNAPHAVNLDEALVHLENAARAELRKQNGE
ncbi:MAG TPA: bifunctional phosphoserine phosphatase/homoserine phosphotransferase ThrH [Candidatus Limnocylindria bacterium]|nr:bifunctional phosphoserine phosphatase/homoserine phosphotransferase ThrH [Candidatus Limnocylindria bacterium]